MTQFAPKNFAELTRLMDDIVGDKTPVNVTAAGTKNKLGNISTADKTLDISALSGVMDYEPEELIITAHAATPLSEIEGLLAKHGQMLAFEPPHLDGLYQTTSTGTIGGALMANLSGPRRLSAGAARDFLLGFEAVSGRGTAFRSGSKVVKNVTGYDLSKLLCGSFGTMAVLDEITIKTLPAPETVQTVVIANTDFDKVCQAARAAMQTAYEASSAAILPKSAHKLSQTASIALIRVEGVGVSVADRVSHLIKALSVYGHADTLDEAQSVEIWRDIKNVSPILSGDSQIWRLSVAPSDSAQVCHAIDEKMQATYFADWAGGMIWVSCDDENAHSILRNIIATIGGGHATLMRGSDELRQTTSVFEPLAPALANLNKRVQESFDPFHLLNPGRL